MMIAIRVDVRLGKSVAAARLLHHDQIILAPERSAIALASALQATMTELEVALTPGKDTSRMSQLTAQIVARF